MKPVLLLFIVMTLLLTAACADDQEETPSAAQVPANATARLAPTPTPTTTPEPTGEASPSPTPSLTLTAPATATPTPIPTQARAPLPPAPVPARDTSTHSRPAQSIVDSIVHVVGDGGSATGIIVDERGYVITSRHITDAILNVDVWLPGGRLVGGTARYRDQETGLVLVELKRADLLDLKPIELEPLVRSTGPGEAIFVVSLAAREVMPAETRLEVGYGISDLAGNEWFRLDSKLPMTSVGGPVLSERFGQIIGILVLKEIAGEVDNFVLKLESLERQIQSLVPGEDAAISVPASTAVPRESAAISEGWTYITPDCREGWTNCEYANQDLSDKIRVTASKSAEDNAATGELPYLEFYCQENGDLSAKFHTGSLEFFNENDSGIVVGVWIDGVQRDLVPVGSYQFPHSSAWVDGYRLARPFNEAELAGRLIEVGSLSYNGKAIGVFDPGGFRSNFWRLPCAR